MARYEVTFCSTFIAASIAKKKGMCFVAYWSDRDAFCYAKNMPRAHISTFSCMKV